MTTGIAVILEQGKKKAFASAADWPGWARVGADERAALESLLAYGPRYMDAISTAKLAFKAPKTVRGLHVVERVDGGSTTDFGVPAEMATLDSAELSERELKRLVTLLGACWNAFDSAVEHAGKRKLETGPRGGGRQTDTIVPHVVDSFHGYLRTLGAPSATLKGGLERADLMALTLDTLELANNGQLPAKGPRGGKRWPARYFVRRAAWHILDHAWEIEDRTKD